MKEYDKTIDYYNANAEDFARKWLETDLNGLREKFLEYLPSKATILDLGCGPGRDLKAFIDRGYKAEGFDGSKAFVKRARDYTGTHIYEGRFEEISLEKIYDGIWACASLLHLKKDEIKRVLLKLRDNLRPDGIFYFSIKKGDFEGLRDGRYYTDLSEPELKELLETLEGYDILETWESLSKRDTGDVVFYNVILKKNETGTNG